MRQARRDPLTGAWTLFASARADRPRDVRPAAAPRPRVPTRDPACPFCPGNEELLLEILRQTPAAGGGWLSRVVTNRYPAVVPFPGRPGPVAPPGAVRPSSGRQEVFIEGPRHDLDLPDAPREVRRAVVADWHARFLAAAEALPGGRTLIFRNRGSGSGMSLRHPHSQLIATDVPAPEAERMESNQRMHHRERGGCLLCDEARRELEDGRRIVSCDDAFVALVPWAAAVPCELRIVPRRHAPHFGTLEAAEADTLAATIAALLGALERARPGVGYNLVVHSPPPAHAEAGLHWFVQIRPREPAPAGYELGTGNRINGRMPEDDAARLRIALDAGLRTPSDGG